MPTYADILEAVSAPLGDVDWDWAAHGLAVHLCLIPASVSFQAQAKHVSNSENHLGTVLGLILLLLVDVGFLRLSADAMGYRPNSDFVWDEASARKTPTSLLHIARLLADSIDSRE